MKLDSTPLRRKTLTAFAATAAAALLLAGCASGDSADSGAGAADGYTVTHALGTTEITATPERVATIAWGNQDVALALGVVPVGMPFVTYADDNGDGILPWVQDALDELGGETPALFDEVDGVNFEEIADTSPDVVLAASSGLTEEEYSTLTEIAPTVAFPSVAWFTTWRESTTMNGAALGLESEADELVSATEKTIADAAAAHPELAGKTFAYLWVDPSDPSVNYVYLSDDARVSFLRELGLEDSEGVKQLTTENEGAFFATLSTENFDILADADIIVNYGSSSTLAAMQADPLLGALPAVKAGAVAIIEDGKPMASAFSSPTVLSIPWGITDYTELLGEAAAKVQ